MRSEFLAPHHPLWLNLLGSVPHDFYHLPAYVELSARMERGEAVAFMARENGACMLAPLILRAVPGGPWRDAASPYGYPTPLFQGAPSSGQVEAFLRAFGRAGAQEGIVSAFFRLHPLLHVPLEPFERVGTVVDHGETTYIDLGLPLEQLDRQTRPSHRAVARKLQANGFRVEVDDWSLLPDFVRIFHETMGRRGACDYYCMDLGYFETLRACLGSGCHLGMALDPAGQAAAGGIFTVVGDLMQFHLAANATAFLKDSPAKLLVMHMRDHARKAGVRYLHLGGGVGCAEDSLAYFKQGFSQHRGRYRTFRMILMPEVYRDLARGLSPADGYFPAYRRLARAEAEFRQAASGDLA